MLEHRTSPRELILITGILLIPEILLIRELCVGIHAVYPEQKDWSSVLLRTIELDTIQLVGTIVSILLLTAMVGVAFPLGQSVLAFFLAKALPRKGTANSAT